MSEDDEKFVVTVSLSLSLSVSVSVSVSVLADLPNVI
jgi:hypothetical protein